MGSDSQPFIYDRPSKYSFVGPSEKGFNPKAASEASWRIPPPKPKSNGPLIQSREFNRHPDSYFVVPYGNLNWKLMSPRTKDKVKWIRISLLTLRVFSLLGAGGMLFCVICIRNTDAMTGWIIRVPAGIAILHAAYAVYHLARFSRGRTPASSASYMLFAAIIDISLIPFYVFAALMARIEYVEPGGTPNRWLTLFPDDDTTYKILYSTFLISVACGVLHLISFILSLYLGVLYRQISRLPPDMNPLQDNLTSRHKRSKSLLTDHRNSRGSTMTLKVATESGVDDPLISPVRTVPFTHTRNKSQLEMSDGSPSHLSTRASRFNIPAPLYQQSPSKRNSGTSFASRDGALPSQAPSNLASRTEITDPMPQTRQPAVCKFMLQDFSQRSLPYEGQPQEQQQALSRSLTKSSSIYSTNSAAATNATLNARSPATVSSLSDNNWITHSSSAPSHSPSSMRELNKAAYQPLSQSSYHEYVINNENQSCHNPENPLEMNPPTPLMEQWKQRTVKHGQKVLAPSNDNVRRQGSWNQGPGTLGIGKIRTWDGMSDLVGRQNEGARVVSRSGVQIRGEGILPSGGMRAREVSGKVMEEGRQMSNWHVASD